MSIVRASMYSGGNPGDCGNHKKGFFWEMSLKQILFKEKVGLMYSNYNISFTKKYKNMPEN